MSSRSSSESDSLADRIARSKAGGQASGRTPAHVDIRADDGTWRPALLITWHRTGTGWCGRTVSAPNGEAIEELVRADRLRPAPRPRPGPDPKQTLSPLPSRRSSGRARGSHLKPIS